MANSFWSLVYYHQAWSLLKEKQTLWMLSECTNIVKQTPSLHVGVRYIIIKLGHCLKKSKLFICFLNVAKSLHVGVMYIIIKLGHYLKKTNSLDVMN